MAMNPKGFDDDPRVRALAELVHQLRPAWNRGGVLSALHLATQGRDLPTLVRAAIDAALDPAAETPAVISHRDGDVWTQPLMTAASTPLPPPFQSSERPPPDTALWGATEARAALRQKRHG